MTLTTSKRPSCAATPPAQCQSCYQYAHCAFNQYAYGCEYAPSRCSACTNYGACGASKTYCDTMPASCTSCLKYAHCVWDGNGDGCDSIPASCQSCVGYTLCASSDAYCATAPASCNNCWPYGYCAIPNNQNAFCATVPDYCQRDCQDFSQCPFNPSAPNLAGGVVTVSFTVRANGVVSDYTTAVKAQIAASRHDGQGQRIAKAVAAAFL